MTVYTAKNVKAFMAALLKGDVFDKFQLREITICSFASFNICGEKSGDEKGTFCRWSEIKPYAFDIIKGKRLPELIKVVFSLPPEETGLNLKDTSTVFLNITYENDGISCVTGMSMKNFSLDRSAMYAFDEYVGEFFAKNGIDVTNEGME